ncbi:acyl-CoA dehydrogenase family protein [Leucobacter massiliensis]|uniref:Acyl-CoA dehydrogenase n=1 Tax=Leucobacter massiliensis TaxID=1686285 RepID=A0A2S9QSP3_9MICO|nr:acyl-CoA dehydrogenase family protein [Leucobacter massiliensis]PRI12616.1 acyl-CoA dehydrogenase [Leucobacter massiliensis]
MADREQRHAQLAERYLPDELIARVRGRAAVYDRENRFCAEDLAEFRERGYLTAFVPERFGGGGLTLHEVSRLQQRLAAAAPATALAVNMHLLCTGVARAMCERGDHSLTSVFEEAVAGEIFAFGISEPGNDWVLQGSTTVAEPQANGGYLLSGTKIFTSLSPAWTRLIVHGLDASEAERPELVFGFVERDAPGITVSGHWNVLGMRASESRATALDRTPLRAERVVRRIPPGPQPDLLVFSIAANFQLLVGSVYAGAARRALELAAAGLRARSSSRHGTSFAEVPEMRARLADAHREFLSVPAQLDACTRDFDELVDHGAGWPLRLIAARIAAGDAARRTAETALACAGGRGFDADSEVSRLLRDVTAGLFHPPGADAARPLFAAALLDED